jgi:rhamnosyltransferase
MTVYSIIVCYQPDLRILNHLIKSIINQSSKVVIVDNSEVNNLSKLKSCDILTLGENKGISYAQNKGIEYAKSKGANAFVFFDQDSEIENNFFINILQNMTISDLSVFSPLIIDKISNEIFPSIRLNYLGLTKKVHFSKNSEPALVDLIISSGSCLNLKTLNFVGLMDEDLFIDFVDTDWSLRCKEKKVPIYIMPNAILKHSIGERNFKILNFTFFLHNNKRVYYQIKNCLSLFKKSHAPMLFVMKELLSLLFHDFFLFFISKNKIQFLKFSFLGFRDGFKFLIK